MKKLLSMMMVLCVLLSVFTVPALAAVSATPNQKLALRTGPNTAYVELYTLPQSTRITAYEYEEGNGVTWVLVEFNYQGETVRGYTGLKRMNVNGYIPWACHDWRILTTGESSMVYAAPTYNAAYRGQVGYYETITLLGYEGDFAYIEFYDAANRAVSRGYVPYWVVNDSGCC